MSEELIVLYEDRDLVVFDKPRGLLVEGSGGTERSLGDVARRIYGPKCRPLHRLDRETTGIVLFAKNALWNRQWTVLFEEKRIRKSYYALVKGKWDKRINRIDTMISPSGNGRWRNAQEGGKRATTTFRVLAECEGETWIEALPKTGRTHQIRLHCLAAGFPIAGDALYGDGETGPMKLHSHGASFTHPRTGERIELHAALPDDWDAWVREEERKRKRS